MKQCLMDGLNVLNVEEQKGSSYLCFHGKLMFWVNDVNQADDLCKSNSGKCTTPPIQ